MKVNKMWNDETLDIITIKNKNGKVIAQLDANTLTCNNKKFSIKPGNYEDELVIQLNQTSYK